MAANGSLHPAAHQMNKNNQFQLNLFRPQMDNDWSLAINNELNIRRRTCTTFIPKDRSGKDGQDRREVQCGCNRRYREHSWDVMDGQDDKWDKKKHTTAAYNNAYGLTSDTQAHYVRCDIETKPVDLAKLMFRVWRMKIPRLIMCIIGGAKYFKLNERLEREFIKGIIQAALKADGWIVTTGFKTGVVQLVGEAIHDHKVTNPKSSIVAVGCSKWGAVRNRETYLLRKPADRNSTDLNASARLGKALPREKGLQDLEPNHTHFLLLDDGTYQGYDIGDYRTRFVKDVSSYDNQSVPIVTIVVEGGPDTLTTIYKDLRSDIPVVLIDGSGRVPNLLAQFLNRTESMLNRSEKDADAGNWKTPVDIKQADDIDKLRKKFEPYADEILDGLKDISKGSKTSDEEMRKLYHCFLYCLQPAVRSRIRIFSLDSDRNLDDTIFEAIIQVRQTNSTDKDSANNRAQLLDLALAWDAIDVAKEYIIKDDLSDLTLKAKEDLFLQALRLNRPNFINIFIKLGFDLTHIFYQKRGERLWQLRWEKLQKVYNETLKMKRERLDLFGKCLDKPTLDSEADLDRSLQKLIGDYMKPIYTHLAPGARGRLQRCCPCAASTRVSNSRANLQSNDEENEPLDESNAEEISTDVRELVYRDLFFWAILNHRVEIAKVILSHMQTRICAALIASKVFKSYLNYAYDNESKDDLRSEAEEFEGYASELLKWCYNYDEDKACEIAIRRINLFGGVTCLQVAVDADDKNFVGQPCCDQLLNNVWYGRMIPIQSFGWKRFLLVLNTCGFGLAAPWTLDFREEKSLSTDADNDRKKQYEMRLNHSAEEEEEEQRQLLMVKNTRRLDNRGVNYSDNYAWQARFCSKSVLNYFHQLKLFHEAPVVKFSYDIVSYIVFLLLFSYFLLFDFNPPTSRIPSIHWTEILVIIIISTMLIEDIRQYLCQDNRTIMGKFSNYFIKNLFFSSIRVTSYILFYIGLILRFTNGSNADQLAPAKILLAYDLEIWFIRSLAFLSIAQKMGPKLVMIRKMIIDLFFFTYIILVAMTAYGVASRSMYDYNADPGDDDLYFDGRSIFRHIIYPVYYLMYGSMDGELSALDLNKDAGTAIATQVLLAFHMLFVNILLINLLIAMFSYTFDSVQAQTDLVWRYERYSLIREYFDRPPLFPPFIIITHFIELIKLLLRHCFCRRRTRIGFESAKTFKMIGVNRKVNKDWSEFESYSTNYYARSIVSGPGATATAKAPSTARQEASQATADAVAMAQVASIPDIKAINDEMASIRKVVADLRVHAEEMNRCMQWMMNAMERVKMSKEPKPRLKTAITTSDIRPFDD